MGYESSQWKMPVMMRLPKREREQVFFFKLIAERLSYCRGHPSGKSIEGEADGDQPDSLSPPECPRNSP